MCQSGAALYHSTFTPLHYKAYYAFYIAEGLNYIIARSLLVVGDFKFPK